MERAGPANSPEQHVRACGSVDTGAAQARAPTPQRGPPNSSFQPGSSRKHKDQGWAAGVWWKQLTKSNFTSKRVFLPCSALLDAFGWEAPEGAKVPFVVDYTTQDGQQRRQYIEANPKFNAGGYWAHRLGHTFTDLLLEMGAQDKDEIVLNQDSNGSSAADKICVTLAMKRKGLHAQQQQGQQQQQGLATAGAAQSHSRPTEAQDEEGAEEGEEYSASLRDDTDEECGVSPEEVGSTPEASGHAGASNPAAKRRRTEPAPLRHPQPPSVQPQPAAQPHPPKTQKQHTAQQQQRTAQEQPAAPQPPATNEPRLLPQAAVDRIQQISMEDTDAISAAVSDMVFAAQLSGPEIEAYFDFYDRNEDLQTRDFLCMRAYLLQGNMVALVKLVRKRLPSLPPPTPQPAAAVPQHALPQADVDRILRLSPDDVKAVDDAIVAMVCSAALTSDEIEAYLVFNDGATAGIKWRKFTRLRGWLGRGDTARLAAAVRRCIS